MARDDEPEPLAEAVDRALELLAANQRQAVAQRDLRRLDPQAEQRRDDDRLRAALEDGGLDLGVGALEALGRDDELRRLAEDAADEDAQRGVGELAWLEPDALLALLAQVPADVEPGQRAGCGGIRRQAAEDADAIRRPNSGATTTASARPSKTALSISA